MADSRLTTWDGASCERVHAFELPAEVLARLDESVLAAGGRVPTA